MPIIPIIGYKLMQDHLKAKEAQEDLTPEQAAALQSGQQPQNLTDYQARVIAAAQTQNARDQGRPNDRSTEQNNQISR